MTEWEKAAAGYPYDAAHDEIITNDRLRCKDLCYEFNNTRPSDKVRQNELLHELIGNIKGEITVTAPFYCDYGFNITMGDGFYCNHNTVILDGVKVSFGHNVLIAPNCVFTTAGHPLDAGQRNAGLEIALPITVGDNVWFGANVCVLPGVTIGSNTIIGAGSVVNKDIPEGVIAAGNPCKVIRRITAADRDRYPVVYGDKYVSFETVKTIFWKQNWSTSDEVMYCYRYIWEFLTQSGHTFYNDENEYREVILLAIALTSIFGEFYSEQSYDNYESSEMAYMAEAYISEEEIRELTGNSDEDATYEEMVIGCIQDNILPKLEKALSKRFAAHELYSWLDITETIYDDDDEDYEEDDELAYRKFVNKREQAEKYAQSNLEPGYLDTSEAAALEYLESVVG